MSDEEDKYSVFSFQRSALCAFFLLHALVHKPARGRRSWVGSGFVLGPFWVASGPLSAAKTAKNKGNIDVQQAKKCFRTRNATICSKCDKTLRLGERCAPPDAHRTGGAQFRHFASQ
jgi:hypothetical protein